MKEILFVLIVLYLTMSVILNLGCEKFDQIDARGIWEITILGLNGNSSNTYDLSGSGENGKITGGYSNHGTGTYNVSGNGINFTYDSNLDGGLYYRFSGHFVARNEMKGTVIISQGIAPESTPEKTFEWKAKRK